MLDDVQNQFDDRGIALDAVGVVGVKRPIVVSDRSFAKQQTVGDILLSTSLGHSLKGSHLSRFMEVLEEHGDELTPDSMRSLLRNVLSRLQADDARIEASFTYFRERCAPVSGARGLIDYSCRFVGAMSGDAFAFTLVVTVPVTSLCPCSRAISDYGAHNQRGLITMRVSPVNIDGRPAMIWIEELGDIAEQSASSPLFPVLKRSDERFVTMAAYDKPVFVEDMVRGVAADLQADKRVASFSVEAVNDESIHNHAAFARVDWSREQVGR